MAASTIPLLLMSMVLATVALPDSQSACEAPASLSKRDSMYSSNTASGLIPFANLPTGNPSFDFSIGPRISYKLDPNSETVFTPPLDTGSCGIMLGESFYPDKNFPTNNPGHEFLSSSDYLYTGYWVENTLYFQGGDNVVSKVPILIVTHQVVCNDYNNSFPGICPTISSEVCGGQSGQECAINYFGVAFGQEADGQDQGTPDKNALLNVQSINGSDIPSNFRIGYTLSGAGLNVGLTANNTANYTLVQLSQYTTYSNDPRDWQGVSGCLSVTAPGNCTQGACVSSSFLLDTGISQSYVTVTPASGVSGPWLTSKTGKQFKLLPAGYTLTANFGGGPNYPASLLLVLGSGAEDLPSYVSASLDTTPGALGFINTGINFYKTHSILFDASGGYWGIRASS